ncbi:MAG: PhzF family phenazine biosynthesis protein [Pseudomonadota bacterium]
MRLTLYQVDAFASELFAGNPAAVVPLDAWLDDDLMRSIAAENNLAETAFFVAGDDGYAIRWFTPAVEVDLCGHATLASAYVLFDCLDFKGDTIVFDSRSGPLSVTREGERLTLDFPSQPPRHCATPAEVVEAFGAEPRECQMSADLIVVFDDAEFVRRVDPNIAALARINSRGVIITAADTQYDFVSRFFGPNVGIDEDPVTGSSFTQLVPYWAEQLSKTSFHAKQVSQRGGEVFCELKEDRVLIGGTAVKYLEGTIEV